MDARWFIFILLIHGTCTFAAKGRSEVVFFGGYGSTHHQMKEWRQKAQETLPYGEEFSFNAVAYPAHSSDQEHLVLASQEGQQIVDFWFKTITHTPQREYILAGHSSGTALSNEIFRRVDAFAKAKKRKSNIRFLYVIDGFYPHGIHHKFACVTAVDDQNQNLNSLGTESMRMCPHKRLIIIKARNCRPPANCRCTQKMCRHFALINFAAADLRVSQRNYRRLGYADLEPNLEWLDPLLAKSSH